MITVTVAFADGTTHAFTLADNTTLLHLKYELITIGTSPLYNQTPDYASINVAYQASQDQFLINDKPLEQNAQYYAALPVPQCAICADDLTADITTLGCGHNYHRGCIAGWTGQGQRTCPTCNAEVIPNTLADISVLSGDTLVATSDVGTFTLNFQRVSLPNPSVVGIAPNDDGRYTVRVGTIGGITPDQPYQLPLMRFDIDVQDFGGAMELNRV